MKLSPVELNEATLSSWAGSWSSSVERMPESVRKWAMTETRCFCVLLLPFFPRIPSHFSNKYHLFLAYSSSHYIPSLFNITALKQLLLVPLKYSHLHWIGRNFDRIGLLSADTRLLFFPSYILNNKHLIHFNVIKTLLHFN